MGALTGKVAITGGVAEGKSTVLDVLADLGLRVASSDLIAKQVFASEKVQGSLGRILDRPLPVSPDEVRERIWRESDLRREVNRAMHPEILNALESSDAQYLEIPLLIETCLQGHFGRVWVVTCGQEEQWRRLMDRVGDRSKAEDILAAQLPSEVKLAFADVVIRTNRPRADVNRFVAAVVGRSVLR